MFSVNTLSKKNTDQSDVWIHVKQEDGELAFIDEKPVRIKVAGFHSDFYAIEAELLIIKLSKLAGEIKESEQKTDALSEREIANLSFQYKQKIKEEELAFYTEITKDWELIPDSNGGFAEFSKENAAKLYEQNPFIANQIKEEIQKAKLFIQG